MISKYHGWNVSLDRLRTLTSAGRDGVSLAALSEAAELVGFRTQAVSLNAGELRTVPLPCVAHWNQNHFIVVYRIRGSRITVGDPAQGLIRYTAGEFTNGWLPPGDNEGVILLLEPSVARFDDADSSSALTGFRFLLSYLVRYKTLLVQLLIGALLGTMLAMVIPFITQAVVDIGIQNHDVDFIYVLLIAQLVLFFSRTLLTFIRSWVLLHVGTRINIAIISDFLHKLLSLPFSFFSTRLTGDILQRIDDHRRVENLMTYTTIDTLFSFLSFGAFSVVLALYGSTLFVVFMLGTIVALWWAIAFMKKRKNLDHRLFRQRAHNQSILLQIILGVQDIKLNNCEALRRQRWERHQVTLFELNSQSLSIQQYQRAGLTVVNELKNIVVIFIAAASVVNGTMTLGMMMAIMFIVGQLNSPIDQVIDFLQRTQDAKLGVERMLEIHRLESDQAPTSGSTGGIGSNERIVIDGLRFRYHEGQHADVLHGISAELPSRCTTAIVGPSGSGKTTLLKLLLKLYQPSEGTIKLGHLDLRFVDSAAWRDRCGVVMQDGMIFSDSIGANVALGYGDYDEDRLRNALRVANLLDFVRSLPRGYATMIGTEWLNLSQGQKQRVLIARAVYRDPDYLFFDEATNALDAENEGVIMRNLLEFMQNRTAVIVAHRLSTVCSADQIIVLNDGVVEESGTHGELTSSRGMYYRLVRNQLELGV